MAQMRRDFERIHEDGPLDATYDMVRTETAEERRVRILRIMLEGAQRHRRRPDPRFYRKGGAK